MIMEPIIDIDRTADLVELLWSVHKPIEDLIRLDDLTSNNDFNNNNLGEGNKASVMLAPSAFKDFLTPAKRSDGELSTTSPKACSSAPPPSPASDGGEFATPTIAGGPKCHGASGEEENEATSFALSHHIGLTSDNSAPPSGVSSAIAFTTNSSPATMAAASPNSDKYTMEALFQLMTKMQRSMETMSKRFVNVEDAIFDLLDETRCPIRRGRMAEKSVQTDVGIGCQQELWGSGELPARLLDHRRTDIGSTLQAEEEKEAEYAKQNSVFRPVSTAAATAKPSNFPDKFTFGSSEDDDEPEEHNGKDAPVDKKTDEKETRPERDPSSPFSAKQQSVKKQPALTAIQPSAKKSDGKEGKRRCVWADESEDSDDSDSELNNPIKLIKKPVPCHPQDNIPDEMKSSASLPWHRDNEKIMRDKIWKERQLQYEALYRELNKNMAEHMLNRPKGSLTAAMALPSGRVGTAEKLGVSPFNRRPQTPTITDSPSRAPGGHHAFFDNLQCDYVLPPHPRAQPTVAGYLQSQRNRMSQPPTRRSVYPSSNGGGGGAHHYRDRDQRYYRGGTGSDRQSRSISRSALLSGPNAIIPPQPSNATQYDSRKNSQSRRQPFQGQEHSTQPAKSGYGEPNRHQRRIVEAYKINVRAGLTAAPTLPGISMGRMKGKMPDKNEVAYTRRGSGIYTTDEEDGGNK